MFHVPEKQTFTIVSVPQGMKGTEVFFMTQKTQRYLLCLSNQAERRCESKAENNRMKGKLRICFTSPILNYQKKYDVYKKTGNSPSYPFRREWKLRISAVFQ